eukprot:GHVU01023099.1.p1 GENE.GHVU01023099.1~~GHVU01023099.1.p1  ORF type:complete len:211 (-),score=0.44 GHVU01023099.1:486-1118(-)
MPRSLNFAWLAGLKTRFDGHPIVDHGVRETVPMDVGLRGQLPLGRAAAVSLSLSPFLVATNCFPRLDLPHTTFSGPRESAEAARQKRPRAKRVALLGIWPYPHSHSRPHSELQHRFHSGNSAPRWFDDPSGALVFSGIIFDLRTAFMLSCAKVVSVLISAFWFWCLGVFRYHFRFKDSFHAFLRESCFRFDFYFLVYVAISSSISFSISI